MPIKVTMPALSPTMEEGKLAKWLKAEGDTIASGDAIAEIETDKATMEVEAVEEGTLAKIVVPEGTEGVKVNAVIALVLEEGEDESALDGVDVSAPAAAPKTEEEAPAPAPAPAPAASAPAPAVAATEGSKAPPAPSKGGERVFSSPLARRIAADNAIDIAQLTGSGPHGRVVKADVERALQTGAGKAASAGAPAAFGTRAEPTRIPHTTMRKTIARRMAQSTQEVPHFMLTVDCEIDQLLAARKQINDLAKGAYKVSVNDFVLKAVAAAMRRVPEINVTYTPDEMIQYNTVDISVAVAIDGGLITPILRDADLKGLKAISEEVKDLAGRAREGKLDPTEYEGGGFTVSNLGMYGIKHFSAIINQPQAAILAVGAGEQRPVVKNGELAVATVMTCTLSVDHRAVDGATGAKFMAELKPLIENPALILV